MSNNEKLNETFRHFNSLIWQLPSWGIAIATAVIVAADKLSEKTSLTAGNAIPNISKTASVWVVPANNLQALILFLGAFLLMALTMALYRYRHYQAWVAPDPAPAPPFRQCPKANRYLQGALCLTTGALYGLAACQLFLWPQWIIVGLIVGIISWIFAEIFDVKVKNIIQANL